MPATGAGRGARDGGAAGDRRRSGAAVKVGPDPDMAGDTNMKLVSNFGHGCLTLALCAVLADLPGGRGEGAGPSYTADTGGELSLPPAPKQVDPEGRRSGSPPAAGWRCRRWNKLWRLGK